MIAVVDGLLPEPHNVQLLTLLYRMAEWHALAKLRMHTDHTLGALDKATAAIGRELRSFRDWSRTSFTVKELPSEMEARRRRKRKTQDPRPDATASNPTTELATNPVGAVDTSTVSTTASVSGVFAGKTKPSKFQAKVKVLNLFTYKLHALGDYVNAIRLFGSTDSYSTQIVCTPHFVYYQCVL